MLTLIQKLQSIQKKLKAPKGQTNKFGGYKYRSLEDIMEAVKPLLAEVDAFITIGDEIVMLGDRFYVKATTAITDSTGHISTTGFAREALTKKGMDESQITGAASSYARKYAMNGLLAIDDTKDADATNRHEDPPPQKTTKKDSPKDKPSKPSKVSAEVLADAYSAFLNKHFDSPDFSHFERDAFDKAVFAKYGKYPTSRESIDKIIEEIDPKDVIVSKGKT